MQNRTAKIIKYTSFDLFRSWWAVLYFLFFLLSAMTLLFFSGDFTRAMSGLLNITLLIVPLVCIIFGTMFFYNSREFVTLLLAQPVKRRDVFLGQYIGLCLSLVLSFVLGLLIAFLLYGGTAAEFGLLLLLLTAGTVLTFIFVGLAFFISASQEDRLKGFGLSILAWLMAAVVYDGAFMALLAVFQDYPMETPSIFISLFNPIDLSRILVLLKLKSATLMGYTGAVFEQFFGTAKGMLLSGAALLLWIVLPVWGFLKMLRRKDF